MRWGGAIVAMEHMLTGVSKSCVKMFLSGGRDGPLQNNTCTGDNLNNLYMGKPSIGSRFGRLFRS